MIWGREPTNISPLFFLSSSSPFFSPRRLQLPARFSPQSVSRNMHPAALLLTLLLLPASASLAMSTLRLQAPPRHAAPLMAPRLHGTQQSRSPLVNWYAEEIGCELSMQPPRPSKHPFGQVPFLEDDGGVEVFESGAILLYLADAYGAPESTAAERAACARATAARSPAAPPPTAPTLQGRGLPPIPRRPSDRSRRADTKWVVWSNSELDGLCFGAVPGDHRVRGTSMDKPDLKSVATLNAILTENDWLVGGQFSVADAAVASYLNCERRAGANQPPRPVMLARPTTPHARAVVTPHTPPCSLPPLLPLPPPCRRAHLLPQRRSLEDASDRRVHAPLRRAARVWQRVRRAARGPHRGEDECVAEQPFVPTAGGAR